MISYSALTLLYHLADIFPMAVPSTLVICGSECDLYNSRVSGWQIQSKEYNYSLSPARHRLQIQILLIVKKIMSMFESVECDKIHRYRDYIYRTITIDYNYRTPQSTRLL